MKIMLYTDGACDVHAANQPGGWAAILLAVDRRGKLAKERVLTGGAEATTNNQMELTAVIEGLKALTRSAKVTVVTDSLYVMNIASGKMKVTRNKKLWQKFFRVAQAHQLDWKYVAGHSGDAMNERCDRLAVKEKEKRRRRRSRLESEASSVGADETDTSIYISTVLNKKKGACAFAAQIVYRDSAQEVKDLLHGNSEQEATLIAAIRALEQLRQHESATVFTAQEYLSKGVNQWMPAWIKRNWKTRDGEPVKYRRHWQRLGELMQGRAVHFRFVKARNNIEHFQLGKEIAAGLLNRD